MHYAWDHYGRKAFSLDFHHTFTNFLLSFRFHFDNDDWLFSLSWYIVVISRRRRCQAFISMIFSEARFTIVTALLHDYERHLFLFTMLLDDVFTFWDILLPLYLAFLVDFWQYHLLSLRYLSVIWDINILPVYDYAFHYSVKFAHFDSIPVNFPARRHFMFTTASARASLPAESIFQKVFHSLWYLLYGLYDDNAFSFVIGRCLQYELPAVYLLLFSF